MKHRKTWLFLLIVYATLWAVTAYWGPEPLKNAAVDSILRERPTARDFSGKAFDPDVDGYPAYSVETVVPAPFVVRVKWGVVYGSLGGNGETVYYIWLPGWSRRVIVTGRWIA